MMLITYTLIEYSRLHAMTIMSPSTCSQALSKGISLHAVTFMLREVDLPVRLIVDLSLARVVQHSPFQFHIYAYTVEVFSQYPTYHSDRMHARIRACMCMTTITLHIQILTLSSLK